MDIGAAAAQEKLAQATLATDRILVGLDLRKSGAAR